MDIKVDLGQLKALPKRLKIIGIVLAAEAFVLLSGYLLLDDMMADRVSQVSQLRTSLTQLRQQNERLRINITRYPDLRQRYDEAMAGGIADPIDPQGLINSATGSGGSHRLSNLRYRLTPDSATPSTNLRYLVGNEEVEFDVDAVLDDDIRAFWQDVRSRQASHYRIVSFTIERAHDPDDTFLASIRRGGLPGLLSATLSLRWTGLLPNSGASR